MKLRISEYFKIDLKNKNLLIQGVEPDASLMRVSYANVFYYVYLTFDYRKIV